MSQTDRGPAASRSRLDRLLLESKLRGPQPQRGAVTRMALIERASANHSKVVSVIAPAGYGKSTMLAEWAATERRAVAWLSLDEPDDDPAVLLQLLAAACSEISSPIAEIAADMRDEGGSTLGRSAPLLAAALAATTTPFVLFVDDVHSASSPHCQDVLEVALGGIPEGCQVVLASRHEQPYLARMRAAGDVIDIDATDLRVDLTGARLIFQQAGATEVSDADLEAALKRCEGWPTGLLLCALIARDGSDAPSVSGDDRYIADYLYRECIERLPQDLQRFLRRTAVLEQLSAAICNAVLDASDSQLRLRELEALNLFLVPLDRTRGWYRYHALFREFLLAELQRLETARIADLHVRAAAWCETNGLPAAAIEHLLAAGDRVTATRLVAETAVPMYQIGQVGIVDRWLSELGDDAVESYPPLAVIACWKALLLGQTIEAERWANAIEGLRYADAGDALTFESARAMIRAAMCVHGAQRALDDATFAVASEPAWSSWRDQALHLYGSTLLLVGDVAGARAAFADGASVGATMSNPDSIVLCEAELAILAIDEENWFEAAQHADIALRMIEASHLDGYGTAAIAFAVSARIALREGDTTRAERLLAKGMRARVLATYVLPFIALRVRLQLAKAYAAKGERVAACALAREMEDVLNIRPDVGVLANEIAAYRRELESIPVGDGAAPLSPAELRVLPYLQTHRTLGQIAQRLFISRNTVNSQVRSIYRKLSVTSRSSAVQRATELGLLGD